MNVAAFGKIIQQKRQSENITVLHLVEKMSEANIDVSANDILSWEKLSNPLHPEAQQCIDSWRENGGAPSYEAVEFLINFFEIDPVYFYVIVLNFGDGGRRERKQEMELCFNHQVINRYLKLIRLQQGLSLDEVARRLWKDGVYITASVLKRFEAGLGPELSGATVCAIGRAINKSPDVMKILNYAAIKAIAKSPEDCRRRFERIARMLDHDIQKIESQVVNISVSL